MIVFKSYHLFNIIIIVCRPQLAQMAQQVQENNPGAFETLREQAARFQPCHNDQPEEKKD